MLKGRYVSTAQIAAALGVSVTTVKRWVDTGILPANKTAGGHRKIPLSEVLRVIREGDFPRLDLSQLELTRTQEAPRDATVLSTDLLASLKSRDVLAARLLLQEAIQNDLPMDVLADQVVAPAMARLGHEWETGRIDVWQEHQGTQICMAALFGLRDLFEVLPHTDAPLALGGGPEDDPYQIANLLAELVLLEAGWQVVNLGPNTPIASFRKALQEFRPRLFWISVSYLENAEGFVLEYPGLYEDAVRLGSAVALGGQALTEAIRVRLPYTTYGDRMAHLAAFATSLQPRPRRRPRGRPRRTP